jgi:hypothetical protein
MNEDPVKPETKAREFRTDQTCMSLALAQPVPGCLSALDSKYRVLFLLGLNARESHFL